MIPRQAASNERPAIANEEEQQVDGVEFHSMWYGLSLSFVFSRKAFTRFLLCSHLDNTFILFSFVLQIA